MNWSVTVESSNMNLVSSELRDELAELQRRFPNVQFRQDPVAYGFTEALVLGLVFVYWSAVSGFAWDMIKLHGKVIASWIAGVLPKTAPQVKPNIEVQLKNTKGEMTFVCRPASSEEVSQAFEKIEITWRRWSASERESSESSLVLLFENGQYRQV